RPAALDRPDALPGPRLFGHRQQRGRASLRHIALGRKNWLFAGSAKGAETAAILFTITTSCHRHGVDAFAYLRDLLERLAHDPQPTPEELRNWLPDRWRPPPPEPPDST